MCSSLLAESARNVPESSRITTWLAARLGRGFGNHEFLAYMNELSAQVHIMTQSLNDRYGRIFGAGY